MLILAGPPESERLLCPMSPFDLFYIDSCSIPVFWLKISTIDHLTVLSDNVMVGKLADLPLVDLQAHETDLQTRDRDHGTADYRRNVGSRRQFEGLSSSKLSSQHQRPSPSERV